MTCQILILEVKKNTSENDELISFLVDEYKSSVANFQKMIVKNFNWKYFD